MTSPNTRKASSYYATAYWRHGNHEVGVVNRGTTFKILVHHEHIMKGVPLKHHVQQINSVRTIACKAVDVLQEVNLKNGLNFQLLCTAQSLGSSLERITAFIIQYPTIEKKYFFLKSECVPNSHQHHTAVFYSPCCETMLSQM